jgi:hypothetical protein
MKCNLMYSVETYTNFNEALARYQYKQNKSIQ